MSAQAIPHQSGSSRSAKAVEKTVNSGTAMLKMKFPNEEVTDVKLQVTCPIEIKFPLFLQDEGVVKVLQLDSSEVFFIIQKSYA